MLYLTVRSLLLCFLAVLAIGESTCVLAGGYSRRLFSDLRPHRVSDRNCGPRLIIPLNTAPTLFAANHLGLVWDACIPFTTASTFWADNVLGFRFSVGYFLQLYKCCTKKTIPAKDQVLRFGLMRRGRLGHCRFSQYYRRCGSCEDAE